MCSGKGQELPEPSLSLFFLIGRIPVLAVQLQNLISLGFLMDKMATIAPGSQGGRECLLGGASGKAVTSLIKKDSLGTSLVVQWLRVCLPTQGLIPGLGTRIPYATIELTHYNY